MLTSFHIQVFFVILHAQLYVQMKLLMLILSFLMTWTVKDKHSVTGDGSWPHNTDARYECTYQKGDVRQGDTATIVLNGLSGCTIEGVNVYVKSNKSSGAGIFTVRVNGNIIATKSGTFKDWTGSYDNTNFHAVSLVSTPIEGVENLSIELVGTANSLHIEKYALQWAQAVPRTVTLMHADECYTTLTEGIAGQGVLLPSLPDEDYWHFEAWSENHFYGVNTPPSSWIEPGRYYPAKDVTLWAVYAYHETEEDTYVTELESGSYLYANAATQKAIAGPVMDGYVENAPINRDDFNQTYEVMLNETKDTATIRHMETDTYIGYSGLNLTAKASPWLVYHEDNKTAFYIKYNNGTYILLPDQLKQYSDGTCFEVGMLKSVKDVSTTPTVLIPAGPVIYEQAFTCHPECGLGIEEVTSGKQHEMEKEWIIPFGNYKLIILNGQKKLQLW